MFIPEFSPSVQAFRYLTKYSNERKREKGRRGRGGGEGEDGGGEGRGRGGGEEELKHPSSLQKCQQVPLGKEEMCTVTLEISLAAWQKRKHFYSYC